MDWVGSHLCVCQLLVRGLFEITVEREKEKEAGRNEASREDGVGERERG